MQLSIIIPVKNEAQNLDACLHSIRAAASMAVSYEILVIDNGSEDDTVKIANKHNATVYIEPHVTVAGLRNIGAQKATGDILAFIDADCTVTTNWFNSLAPYLADDSVKTFGSPPGIPEQPTWVQECWFQIRKKGTEKDPVVPVEWLESMNLFVRRDVFNAVNGFDTKLITCEDYDLSTRLSEHGEIISDARIHAIHHGEARTVSRFFIKERWRGVSNIESFRLHNYSLTELPSLLFPLVQLLAILFSAFGLIASLLGYFPFWLWIVAIVLWQAPLLWMAHRKSSPDKKVKQTTGLWALLNVYMTARGLSLFTGAAWR